MENIPIIPPNCTELTGTTQHLFLTLINILYAAKCSFPKPEEDYPPDYGPKLKDGEEFDFIVVGGGSAGSVVTSRLSEVPGWRVLLLEAGGYPSSTSDVPSLIWSLQGTEEDWQYKTEPCANCCLGMEEGRCSWPRGKTLGGSSSLNVMLYLRGNKQDYENWVKMGNKDWNYDSVLKFFKKIEKLEVESLKEKKIYGEDGYLPLTQPYAAYEIRESIRKAAEELGFGVHDSEKPLGFFDSLTSISNGIRCNAARSYLGKVKERPNLFVATKAYVTKILFHPNSKKVSGVEVFINGKTINLKATKEVILSAGSINSPHILMNSGIGPKEHLAKHGISVMQDLPVGQNLQDHISYQLTAEIDEAVDENAEIANHLLNYFVYRKGPVGKVALTNSVGFISTKNNSNYPNIQLIPLLIPKNDEYLSSVYYKGVGYKESIVKAEKKLLEKRSLLKLLVVNAYPESTGYIELKNNDPFEKPLIHPNYLSDPEEKDLNTILEGIRAYQKILKSSAFEKHRPRITNVPVSNCGSLEFDSDDYWKCMIKNLATTVYHPAGTCKMGPRKDKTSVVNPKLQVHGIEGLRVIDASIMPKIVSVNINGPTLMIGEKGSHYIKKEWHILREEL